MSYDFLYFEKESGMLYLNVCTVPRKTDVQYYIFSCDEAIICVYCSLSSTVNFFIQNKIECVFMFLPRKLLIC